MDSYFYLFIRLLSTFFLFYVKMQTKARSNCAIIDCNLSKKHKHCINHRTRVKLRRSYVFLSFLLGATYLYKTLGTDIKATQHQEVYFRVSWIHLADACILPFWWKSSLHPSIIVWVAIYIYFCDTFY